MKVTCTKGQITVYADTKDTLLAGNPKGEKYTLSANESVIVDPEHAPAIGGVAKFNAEGSFTFKNEEKGPLEIYIWLPFVEDNFSRDENVYVEPDGSETTDNYVSQTIEPGDMYRGETISDNQLTVTINPNLNIKETIQENNEPDITV